jgi:serine/threonine protein kinase
VWQLGSLVALDALDTERKGKPIRGWDATKKSITLFGIAAPMPWVHSRDILHRNLKPENAFVNARLEPCMPTSASRGPSAECSRLPLVSHHAVLRP